MAVIEKNVAAAECAYVASWIGLGIGDTGEPVQFGGAPDRSVHVFGNFSGVASIIIQGSNDGLNWFTLTNPLGGDLIFTADGGKAITELTRHVRPVVSGGDGSTDLDVVLCMGTAK